MTRFATLALFVALSVSPGAQTIDDLADLGNGPSETRAREDELATAMVERNQLRLERLLAAGYVLRSAPDIDRALWIRNAMTLCWGRRFDIDHFHEQQYGDVVIASFDLTFYEDPTTCRPAVLRSVITDVWVRGETDAWQLQIRHAAPPPPPDAGVLPQYGFVPEPPPEWDISSELSLVATAGNTSTRTIGLGADVAHHVDRMDSRALIAFLSSEAESVTQARSLTLRGRHGFRFSERLQVFGEGSFARDRFAGIDGRTILTGGLGYTPPLARPQSLTIEIGSGITVERRVDAGDLRFATASGAVHYIWTILPGSRLTEDVAVDADLDSGRNWRGTSATAVTFTLSRLISLKASHAIEYRHAPVAGFGRTDMRTAVALVFSLQRRPPARP